MRHKLLVLTVKKILQSVYIYGSYRKIKTGVPFFLDHPVYSAINSGRFRGAWVDSEALEYLFINFPDFFIGIILKTRYQ